MTVSEQNLEVYDKTPEKTDITTVAHDITWLFDSSRPALAGLGLDDDIASTVRGAASKFFDETRFAKNKLPELLDDREKLLQVIPPNNDDIKERLGNAVRFLDTCEELFTHVEPWQDKRAVVIGLIRIIEKCDVSIEDILVATRDELALLYLKLGEIYSFIEELRIAADPAYASKLDDDAKEDIFRDSPLVHISEPRISMHIKADADNFYGGQKQFDFIAEHVAGCEPCRREYEFHKSRQPVK